MSKKSIDRKATKQFVLDNRDIGKTDQEIYNELTQQYYDKKGIALLITGTVRDEYKTKYKIYNNILLGLIGVTILFKIIAILSLSITSGQLWAMLFVFVVPLLNVYFLYEIARYNGPIYRFVGILTIASFLQTIGKGASGNDILLNLVLSGAIVGLAFYLDSNMFPDYRPKNLKMDTNGEYILS